MTPATASLAVDPRGLEALRQQAGSAPEKALREASKQFETLFVNMLLKSMRDATPQNGLMDSEQSRTYTGMLDQQLAQAVAGRGIGLAEVMARQLSSGTPPPAGGAAPVTAAKGPMSLTDALAAARTRAATPPAVSAGELPEPPKGAGARARAFIDRMWPHAVEASRATGIPPNFILGQAALESGWGRREITTADGRPSHNLFGIKAGSSWKGATTDTTTHEYINGVKQKVVDGFRAYKSYAESFMDYANLLKNNPRYEAVLGAQDAKTFAQGLQRAGYATDPAYAAKLQSIIGGTLMRNGLSL